ncbi:family 16 glycoside hydrolase [Bradyrhizobium sp. SRS-191]|uniref:family 16 glycoside hydrolase n=1 Tax=Bradyrhizobium sp. SRS-191 TaxID=2962606 RepID=UPI00211EB82C|nr:family 16 glycoside hydrolase [Bradyrhizobium sp. SRS-191]
MLPFLRQDPSNQVEIQNTEFTGDLLGRYVCSTFDEAANNGGRPFDVVVIGAGMFGAYVADKIYRGGADQNLRILLLDAGGYLVSTHVQNLPHLGLNPPDSALVTRNDQDPGGRNGVWGNPWHSNEPFTGLAYCPGGRSLFWGGWSPRLTPADLAAWPKGARDFLTANYPDVEAEIGVQDKADYLSGPLNAAINANLQAVTTGANPVIPNVTVDMVEEAPIAVQASAPGPGLFSFDKFSSGPMLLESIRDDIAKRWTLNDNSRRRFFLVPRCHVIRLKTTAGSVTGIDLTYNGQFRSLSLPANLSPDCRVILAAGTIESTRLALESFPITRSAYGMGANFMAHLRTNLTVRVKRSALGLGAPTTLEQGGAIVRGEITDPGGSKRRYHIQVLASAEKGQNPEATMWTMVPDIDLLRNLLSNEDPDWVAIVFRGLGEMDGDKRAGPGGVTSFVNLTNAADPLQNDGMSARAWVNFTPTSNDYAAWRELAAAAVKLAERLGKNPGDVQYLYNGGWQSAPPSDPFAATKDQLGNTHHEAGTLWMGEDPATSITDTNGRFHHISNAYVAGPALFPTVGSANPSLTGLTLARRTSAAVISALAPTPLARFTPLYTGSLADWQMSGAGGFLQVYDILESVGGPGLLWYTRESFSDFVLELEWQYANRTDNSGIFIRVPNLNSSNPNDWTAAIDQSYEIQIDPRGYNSETNMENDPLRSTGAIYNINAPIRTDVAKGPWQWNKFVIEAVGNRIRVTLNDVLVNDFTDPKSRSLRGHLALQNHHDGSKVQFRNIRIKTVLPGVTELPVPKVA